MNPEVAQSVLAPRRQVLTVVWSGMLAATFFYPLVAYLLGQGRTVTGPEPNLVVLLSALAVAQGGASLVIERIVLSNRALRRRLATLTPEGAAASATAAAERRLAAVADFYQQGCNVRLALAEAVAVIGFVLFMLGLPVKAMIPFSAVAAVLVWLARPRLDDFVARAREIDPTF